jgi:protein TonB
MRLPRLKKSCASSLIISTVLHALIIFIVPVLFIAKSQIPSHIPVDVRVFNSPTSEKSGALKKAGAGPSREKVTQPSALDSQDSKTQPSEGKAEGGSPSSFYQAGSSELQKIRDKISDSLTYPISLQRRRISGTVQVRISIGSGGALLAREVEKSSGHSELDELALEAIDRAAPFPEIKNDLPVDQKMNLVVPIDFQLH